MMSVADSDNLQNLLTNLNIDISPGYNNDKKVEKLVLQLGELSSRYSDLASRYLKLVNSKVNEPFTNSIQNLSDNISSPNNGIQKALLEILAVTLIFTLSTQILRNSQMIFLTVLHQANLTRLLVNLQVIWARLFGRLFRTSKVFLQIAYKIIF
jgi:hypothetical protein